MVESSNSLVTLAPAEDVGLLIKQSKAWSLLWKGLKSWTFQIGSDTKDTKCPWFYECAMLPVVDCDLVSLLEQLQEQQTVLQTLCITP